MHCVRACVRACKCAAAIVLSVPPARRLGAKAAQPAAPAACQVGTPPPQAQAAVALPGLGVAALVGAAMGAAFASALAA
jgi:hypothetical protein